jgi:hypothetical protein
MHIVILGKLWLFTMDFGGSQMKSTLKNVLLGLLSVLPLAAFGQTPSQPGTKVPAESVDPKVLDDYQNRICNDFGASSDIIELNYHDETQTVDLSTFDGHTYTVPIETMEHPVPNGE